MKDYTRYYLDCEFVDNSKTIELISIGIVCSDGREYYAISKEFNPYAANDWVKENVLLYLPPREVNCSDPSISPRIKSDHLAWKSRQRIKEDLMLFFAGGEINPSQDQHLDWDKAIKDIEIWTYYGSYDHICLCQLFGTMMDLPTAFPMYTMDLKQWSRQLGDPELPQQTEGEHHALSDARHNKVMWEFLHNLSLDCTIDG